MLMLAAAPEVWRQVYAPHGWPAWASAAMAGLPVLVLFYLLGVRRVSAARAAAGGAATAVLVATLFAGMPWPLALASLLFGMAYGLLPISWIVFAAIFLYQIAVDTGQFEVMKRSIARLTADRRLQVLLIAFSFGAVMEGAAGFGAPVAISAALLVGLGFQPLRAAIVCLIANTAPVAWGSIGTPLISLAEVSGLPIQDLSAMNARILPITSVIVPVWLVRSMVPWRETLEVMPAALVSGLSFAITQFLWGNWVNVGLVDIVAGIVSLASLTFFLFLWKPRRIWRFPEDEAIAPAEDGTRPSGHLEVRPAGYSRREVARAWVPFAVLSIFVILWGLPAVKGSLDTAALGPLRGLYEIPVPNLHGLVLRSPPVVTAEKPEKAIFRLNWLSATGTGVFLAAILTAILLGHRPARLAKSFRSACRRMAAPVAAIAPMLGLGHVTRYSGIDAILGLTFTRTGVLYPFFGTFLGWLGVALTGSDTASNVLFGSLQRITAEQLGLDPILLCSANSAGGVMGKMVDAQSIVVAAAAANILGQEGKILRGVIGHSLGLALVVALIVLAYAYLLPGWVPHGVELWGK